MRNVTDTPRSFPALAELSWSQAGDLIEANNVEFLLGLGRAGGGEERDEPHLQWVIGGSPVDYHNCVVRTDLAPEQVEAAVDEVVERLQAHGVPGTWHLGQSTRPADLAARLRARGFTGGWSDAGMAADLAALPERVLAPPELRITRVRDRAGLATWAQVRALDPEGEAESRWVAEMYAALGLEEAAPWRHYVGWLGARPVATATMLLAAGVAGLYFVLTVPEARRQGIGAAITLAPLLEARALGYRIGVLGASEMGRPVYRRLGFEEYCRLPVYEWSR